MPLPADHHASYTSSSEKIDLVCMRLATTAADVEKDSRAMENIIQGETKSLTLATLRHKPLSYSRPDEIAKITSLSAATVTIHGYG